MPASCSRRLASLDLPRLIAAAILLFTLLVAPPLEAAICGDDVGGTRIACACGDVVVSDTTLRVGDPVVSGRCPHNGLIIRAPAHAESLTLDLSGLAIVGTGSGYGLRIDRGGADGATIVGGKAGASGEIVGFRTGVLAPNATVLSRIEHLAVKGSRNDGLRLRVEGVMLIDVSSTDNGSDGIQMSGRGGRLIRVEASGNRESGVRLRSRGTIIQGQALSNGGHGIISGGPRNDVSGVVARDNGGVGVIVRGSRQKTAGLVTEGNGLGGLRRSARELAE